jgi:predicted O-methyltransferase YrrM
MPVARMSANPASDPAKLRACRAKWWSANLKNRSLFAIRNPRYAIRAVIRDLFSMDEKFLAIATGSASPAIRSYLNEPFEDTDFMSHLAAASRKMSDLQIASADCYAKRVVLQYAVARASKPDLILETGIANGVSSAYLLLALHRNGRGTLHSIELGDTSYLPPGHLNGWIVPDSLRSRWSLHLGDSRELLPAVLKQLGTIDIFIHDSLHTYDHMKFEYREAYPYLRPGGLLISDDALWNPAFPDFAREAGASASQILRGVGVLQKPL